MTNSERLKELEKLKEKSRGILSHRESFKDWYVRTSSLIAFDPKARRKFDELCDYIIRKHAFDTDVIHGNVAEAQQRLDIIVARSISDLEVNHP